MGLLLAVVKNSNIKLLAGLLFFVAVVFLPVLWNGFTNWDDDALVTGNAYIQAPTWHNFTYLWLHPHIGLYFPMTYSSYFTDQLVGGGKAWAFHLTNVLLHLGAVGCAFQILFLLLGRKRDFSTLGACAAGALLFGLHPIQAEAVSWVSGRKDVLGGFLALAATWQYLAAQTTSLRRLAVSAFATYVLSLLAKPGAAGLPLALLGLDCLVLRRPLRKSALSLLPWAMASAAIIAVTSSVQLVEADIWAVSMGKRLIVACDSLGFYAGKIIYPHGFATDYGRTPMIVQPGPAMIGGIALLAALILPYVFHKWRLAGAAGFYLALLLPVLGLKPFAYQHISTVADRYAYLPMAGVAMGFALTIASALRRRPDLSRVVWISSAALLFCLGVITNAQTRVWKSSESLWLHNISVAPQAAEPHCNLAGVYDAQGHRDLAIAEVTEAVRLKPDFATAHANLGIALMETGETTRGLEHLKRGAELSPRSEGILFNYGNGLAQMDRPAEAIVQFRRAIDLNPRIVDARRRLALALEKLGRHAEAVTELEAITREFPDYQPARKGLGPSGPGPK